MILWLLIFMALICGNDHGPRPGCQDASKVGGGFLVKLPWKTSWKLRYLRWIILSKHHHLVDFNGFHLFHPQKKLMFHNPIWSNMISQLIHAWFRAGTWVGFHQKGVVDVHIPRRDGGRFSATKSVVDGSGCTKNDASWGGRAGKQWEPRWFGDSHEPQDVDIWLRWCHRCHPTCGCFPCVSLSWLVYQ